MTRLATILSFLLLGTFLLTCSEEPTSVSLNPPPPTVKKGTICGYLKGDGRLVPNKSYESFEVELYQNNILLQTDTTDTTDTTGYFSFADLDAATYELKATTNFGYENIAYANDVFVLTDTLLQKDLLLDSLKYDFSPFHLGGTYIYYLEGVRDGAWMGEMASTVEITITNIQQGEDTSFYFFEGENRLEYSLYDPICNWEDSVSVIRGYFKDYNSQVSCVVTEGNGCFFADIFKGVHIYDGSEETNNFLSLFSWLSYDPETIEFGLPFEVNNEEFETLYLDFKFASMGRSKYQFSDELGVVSRSDIFGGTNHLSAYKLTLIDYDF